MVSGASAPWPPAAAGAIESIPSDVIEIAKIRLLDFDFIAFSPETEAI